MRFTISDLIVETLEQAGVRRVYGLPGDSLNGFTDALRRNGTLAWQHVRHEEAAAFAAAGEPAITGELAVCAASCGPGNLHLINGLFDAHRSRVPVLAIAAHIPSVEIGTTYFQETHPQELFRECSVYCELRQLAGAVPARARDRDADRGRDSAMSRCSSCPATSWSPRCPRPRAITTIRSTAPVVRPSDGELARPRPGRSTRAERVTILAGAGCAGAHDQVVALGAGAAGADRPHAARQGVRRARQPLRRRHDRAARLHVGLPTRWSDCDALLMLGTDFPYRDFYPDARDGHPGRRPRRAHRPPHDGRRPAGGDGQGHRRGAAAEARSRRPTPRHLTRMREHYAKNRKSLRRRSRPTTGTARRSTRSSWRATIDELADPDAVFIPDVGTPVIWAARYLRMNGRRRLIGSFSHGSMANALPQAIGVQASQPGRQVVTLSGDGGLAMMLGDLITLQQLRLPVKVVVFNNGALSFVELEMKAERAS